MIGRFDCRVCKLNDDERGKFDDKVVGKTDRNYTDIPCLCFLLFMVIMDVTLFGVLTNPKEAKPRYIFKGSDYNGTICDNKIGWFNFTDPNYKVRRCVDSCDEISTYTPTLFVNYWCIPDPDIYESEYENDVFEFSKATGNYRRVSADVRTLRWWMLGFSIGSIATSLMYLFMIWINKRGLAYFVMNVICGIIAASILIAHAGIDNHSKVTDDITSFEIIQGAVILFFVIVILIYFYVDRETLTTEIEMMAEAMETIGKLWGIIVFAFIYALFLVACAAYWTYATFYMYSVFDRHDNVKMPTEAVRELVPNQPATYTEIILSDWKKEFYFMFHFIFLIYMAFVFCYFGYLVISHMVIVWYLEKNEEEKYSKKDGCCTCFSQNRGRCCVIIESITKQFVILWRSIWIILRYHLGTASFAACTFIFADLWISRDSKTDKIGDILKECIKGCCYKIESNENKENEENQNQHKDVGRGTRFEMTKEQIKKQKRREVIYADVKKRIFPLIEKKIENLAYEHMLSAVIDQQMENIAGKHYSTHDQDDEVSANIGYGDDDAVHVTPGGPVSGYDDEKENKVAKLVNIIKDNMEYLKYEDYIKEDIEAEIDREIEKLDKKVDRKIENERKNKNTNEEKNEDGNHGEKRRDREDGEYDDNTIPTKIRKEGLIFTALYGTSLCYSSGRSIKLEQANETRLNVGGYSNYTERFGRIGIASFTTAISLSVFFYLDEQNDIISTMVFPSMMIFLTSYTIGYVFTMILEATVSSLLFCVMLNEERWIDRFPINQGKIKSNVSKLGGSLSAMLSEHLLIMQLKDKSVNDKIDEMNEIIKQQLQDGDEKELSEKDNDPALGKLKKAKDAALSTEKALLESIDGPMKLTEYLIKVILVENYFNKKYNVEKKDQEIARKKYVDDIANNDPKYRDFVNEKEEKNLKIKGKVTNFLDYYPISDPNQLENAWKKKINRVVSNLHGMSLEFRLKGAKKKGIERAFYKSFYSYHKDEKGFLNLTDVLRCSFVFDDFDNLYGCFKEIINMKDEFEILRIKDKFKQDSVPSGYRDLMINVFCKNAPKIEGIICEIQLHHEIFYKAKKVSHQMYKKTRLFEMDDGQNQAYEYAKKYIRPVLGRFKTYPEEEMTNEKEDDLDQRSDIMKVIEPTITKLAYEYCQKHVIGNLSEKEMTKVDLSKLAKDKSADIILPEPHEQTLIDIQEEDPV